MRGWLSVVVLLCGCGGGSISPHDGGPDARVDGGVADGGGADTGTLDAARDASRVATFDAAADASPVPDCPPVDGMPASLAFDPPVPWSGSAVRVRASSDTGYTNVAVRFTGGPALPDPSFLGVSSSPPFTWSWSVSPLVVGAWCVELSADPGDTVYARAPLRVVADPPPVAPFKVVSNHQWTCEEMETWFTWLDVRVEDETGAPIPGARVLLSHPPCDLRGLDEPPAELVMGDDGTARWENLYPHCFFHLRMAEAPSDTAIEVYTGIWEDQDDGSGGRCNYCSTFAVNVWGHWTYTVTFRRSPGATELCEVGADHAGQSRCSPLMHWEEPAGCTPL